MNSAWDTSKHVAGVASTTMHHCALPLTGFLLLNALYKAAVKKLRETQSIFLTLGLRATRVPSAHIATWLIPSPCCTGVSLPTSRAGSSDVRFVELPMLIY